jgi:hypothetical protein
MSHPLCHDLINRNPDLNIRTIGFSRACTGQERRVRPCVVARTVIARGRVLMVQAAQHLDGFLQR